MDGGDPRPDGPRPSVYDEEGAAVEPDVPVGQAEPEPGELDTPSDPDLPTTSIDPPAAS
jgi:hypothetical protein